MNEIFLDFHFGWKFHIQMNLFFDFLNTEALQIQNSVATERMSATASEAPHRGRFLSGGFFLRPSSTLRSSLKVSPKKHNKEIFFLKSGSVSDRYENACTYVFWLERLFFANFGGGFLFWYVAYVLLTLWEVSNMIFSKKILLFSLSNTIYKVWAQTQRKLYFDC